MNPIKMSINRDVNCKFYNEGKCSHCHNKFLRFLPKKCSLKGLSSLVVCKFRIRNYSNPLGD